MLSGKLFSADAFDRMIPGLSEAFFRSSGYRILVDRVNVPDFSIFLILTKIFPISAAKAFESSIVIFKGTQVLKKSSKPLFLKGKSAETKPTVPDD